MKIKQEDGTEVEVFTAEEVAEKVQEKENQINELSQKSSVLEAEKQKLEEQLGTTKQDNPNFATLKEALDKKTEEIKSLSTEISSIKDQTIAETRDSLIGAIAKNDEEMKKKILHHFNKTLSAMPSSSKDDIKAKVAAAVKLADGGNQEEILDAVFAGGEGFKVDYNKGSQSGGADFSAREIAIGNKLNITEEDRKKYGPKLSINK